MSKITKQQRKELYTTVKHLIGFPIRDIELTEEMMDTFLKVSIEDYTSYMNNWLIEQQWTNLQNLEVDNANIMFALTSKSLDFERSFSYAYSKQVSLGTNAPTEWELKKDYVTVSANTQTYVIPANREISEVLWFTPPILNNTGIIGDPFTLTNIGTSFGFSYGGQPAQYMQPTYTLLLNAQDRKLKKNIIQSELTYRITAGANGTKILYLYPIPGSPVEFTGTGGRHLEGSKVWYFYYETNSKGRKKCLEQNSDIIKLPNDVPMKDLDYNNLNNISQIRVRKLLVAITKMTLGNIRGKFSGALKATDAELVMDYRLLYDAGEKEKDDVFIELKESLDKLTLKNMMEDRASIAQNVNIVLGFIPPSSPILPI